MISSIYKTLTRVFDYFSHSFNYVFRSLHFPENAVLGGYDPYGYDNFMGRVLYQNSFLPSRVRAENGYASFNTVSEAIQAASYELLLSNETVSYAWVRSYDGFRELN